MTSTDPLASATAANARPSIALIGLGPRGISVLERLSSVLVHADSQGPAAHPEHLDLHLIDATAPGGRIWDINQTRNLCMNTFAGGMTLFAEPGSSTQAPVVAGPILYEWVRLLLGDPADRKSIDAAKVELYDSCPADPAIVETFEPSILENLRPESYPPRAVYSYYSQWVYDVAISRLPDWVRVHVHQELATDLSPAEDSAAADIITLASGKTITATSTIFTSGWQDQGYNKQEKWILGTIEEYPELQWIRAGNPIDQNIDSIPAGANVIIRGLGMSFFDVLILSTVERGGRFVEDESARGGLRYEPSGREPRFLATSRRGYPFLPQADYKAVPGPADIPRLTKVVAELSDRDKPRSINYDTEVWPAVAKDAYANYVNTADASWFTVPREEVVAALDATELDPTTDHGGLAALDATLHSLAAADSEAASFSLIPYIDVSLRPQRNTDALTEDIAASVEKDIAASADAPNNPVRAALWSLGWSRKPTQVLGAEGRYTVESRRRMFNRAINAGQMACSGPPLFRSRQLLALVDAGIVTFLGGHPALGVDEKTHEWAITSSDSGSRLRTAPVLVDAWTHKPTVLTTPSDGVMRGLLEQGRLRPFTEYDIRDKPVYTASPELDFATRKAVTLDGSLDPRLHLVGIPAHEQYPDTTLAPPIPGTDSWFIQETDKAARSAWSVVTTPQEN